MYESMGGHQRRREQTGSHISDKMQQAERWTNKHTEPADMWVSAYTYDLADTYKDTNMYAGKWARDKLTRMSQKCRKMLNTFTPNKLTKGLTGDLQRHDAVKWSKIDQQYSHKYH